MTRKTGDLPPKPHRRLRSARKVPRYQDIGEPLPPTHRATSKREGVYRFKTRKGVTLTIVAKTKAEARKIKRELETKGMPICTIAELLAACAPAAEIAETAETPKKRRGRPKKQKP